jgi:putative nucleotidyltransferase with HDIG domain
MNASSLIARVPHLPAPAPSVARLLSLLSRPDADNEEIIQVVGRDGVLCAKLLGLCNAASYGLATPVGSIEQAVMYLGHREIHRLLMSVGFGGALSRELTGYAIGEHELWRHSLLTAYVAVDTAARLPNTEIDSSITYTAGLIHDIGKVVISYSLDASTQAAVLELIEQKKCSLIQAEREVVGTDHAEVGACLLSGWQLPEILIEAVANHHQPVFEPKPELSAIVHVADVIALEAGCSPGLGSYAMRADEEAIAALGLTPEDMERLVISAFDSLTEVEERVAVS